MIDIFRFIVIADSHIRPPDQEVAAYPSNALMAHRNRFIVDLCNDIDAAFVVHLGDIVHPLPVDDTHEEAIELAKQVYSGLRHAIHYVAGNHDVGDKPNALVAVPAVAEENYDVYEKAWGPSFLSFDHDDCHFVLIDTQVLNSGLEREHDQRIWLESDLAGATAAGQRVFLFTHYPPFIQDHNEHEHYDNIGEPARSWLLDLLVRHDVEALFAGHVHSFQYNRHEGTDIYVAPSTAFVRPDYSELASIAPLAENGRDDPSKLGVLVVEVTADGHATRPIRSFGSTVGVEAPPVSLDVSLAPAWQSPIGVTLRHGWADIHDFPTAGLDEFRRKRVRNDGPLLALWEARINNVRVPISDLHEPAKLERIRHLTDRGMRFSITSAGVPDQGDFNAVQSNAMHISRWDVLVPPELMDHAQIAVAGARIRDVVHMAVAPVVPIGSTGAETHHFVAAGFRVEDDPHLQRWLEIDRDSVFGSLVFRVPWRDELDDGLLRAKTLAGRFGRMAVVIVDMPRASEGSAFTDDEAVCRRVTHTVRAAIKEPDVSVFLDGFMDHDRGYYPRHGLIDRGFNPRPALYSLIAESAGATTG